MTAAMSARICALCHATLIFSQYLANSALPCLPPLQAAKVPAPSPTTSFKVHTAEDAPVLELPPCPPCNVAAEEPEAVDVFPRTSAPPCVLTADELLGGSPPVSACAEGAAVAYRNEAQQLAWARGKLLTWAAVARQQQQQQWDSAAAPAGPVEIDDKWNFTFVCLEAAAKVGMRTTYAMAAAGAC